MADERSDDLMGEVMALVTQAEALCAVGAELARRLERREVPGEVAPHLEKVAELAAPGIDRAPEAVQRASLGAIRALMRQSMDLLERPERPVGWGDPDPALLDEQGRASGAFGPVLAAIVDEHGPRGARRWLDVGTGAGFLAMALARTSPDAEVVGIDRWAPAVARATHNVEREGLAGRVRIVERDAASLGDVGAFTAVWLPGPFLGQAAARAAMREAHRVLVPGGLVLFGRYAGPPGHLGDPLADLRTVRSGGHPFSSIELSAMAHDAGFARSWEAPRTWRAPMRLFVAAKGPA